MGEFDVTVHMKRKQCSCKEGTYSDIIPMTPFCSRGRGRQDRVVKSASTLLSSSCCLKAFMYLWYIHYLKITTVCSVFLVWMGEGDVARFLEFVWFSFNFHCLKDFLLIDIDL